MKSTGRNYTLGGQLPCGLGALLLALALSLLAGCGPVRLIANTNIPTPLVVKMPIAVALFIPKEFSSYVHNEERWSTDWHVELGKAQSEGITRLMNAMFERVVAVDSVGAGARTVERATAADCDGTCDARCRREARRRIPRTGDCARAAAG